MNKENLKNISAFPLGEENTAYAEYFTGTSYLSPLNNAEVSISNVTFEPGCRNNWHIHHGCGQILICVGGHGWYVEENKTPRLLSPGDIVYIAPEVKHWHGAVSNEAFAHLALSVLGGSHTNEWLEPVADEEYNALRRN